MAEPEEKYKKKSEKGRIFRDCQRIYTLFSLLGGNYESAAGELVMMTEMNGKLLSEWSNVWDGNYFFVFTLDQSEENPKEEEDPGNKEGKNQRKYQ